jgi:hypothetical protein
MNNPNEALTAQAANLEVVAMGLIEDTEQRLNREKDLRTRELLGLRHEELKTILTSLVRPMEKQIAKAEARLQSLQEDPLSVGSHEFWLASKATEQPEKKRPYSDSETEMKHLIRQTEQRLDQEKDPWVQKMLEDHLQELKIVLASLQDPQKKDKARTRARLQLALENPLSDSTHEFLNAPRKTEQPENGAQAA